VELLAQLLRNNSNAQAIVSVPFLGGPTLRGYTVASTDVKPGDKLGITLYWQSRPPRETPVNSFVHVRNGRSGRPNNLRSGSDIWAQAEHMVPGGRLTTEYWAGQIYADYFMVHLPDDMPSDVYFLEIGWFDPQSGEQLDPIDEAISPPLRELWRSVLLPSITVH